MEYHPLIGITTSARTETGHFRLSTSYVDAVRRAGGIPILLPPGEPFQAELLERLDGLILSGGGDMDPAWYGGRPHPTMFSIDAERDESEVALVRQLVERGMPTLCICRGAQVLNVACGGMLWQDIPSQIGNGLAHQVSSPRDARAHRVAIAEGSRLAALVAASPLGHGDGSLDVNSRHHQAVKQPGEGLLVTATAPDGVVEAIEDPRRRFVLGVQWHPENFYRTGEFRSLFEALVNAARV